MNLRVQVASSPNHRAAEDVGLVFNMPRNGIVSPSTCDIVSQ